MSDIKDVFDKFKEDDIVSARAELAPMIRKALNDRIKEKLNLETDPVEDIGEVDDDSDLESDIDLE